MKKTYAAPSVEITKFVGEDTMTIFKSSIATAPSISGATTDLSQDF